MIRDSSCVRIATLFLQGSPVISHSELAEVFQGVFFFMVRALLLLLVFERTHCVHFFCFRKNSCKKRFNYSEQTHTYPKPKRVIVEARLPKDECDSNSILCPSPPLPSLILF